VAESKISDVARMAGVSVSTVLNVLDGQASRMRPDAVRRIKKAVAALDYRPEKGRAGRAGALRTGAEAAPKERAPLLGLLVPSIANPFFGVLASEIERAAHSNGYRVLFGNTYRDPKKERELLEDFFAHGIRGVITASSLTTQDHYVRLLQRGLTIVSFDRRAAPDKALPIDYVHAGYAATRHLILNGHSAIAYVTAPMRTSSRTDRRAGYVSAMQEAGFGKNVSIVEAPPDTPYDDAELVNAGRRIGKVIVEKKKRPTGLVAMSDIIAIGVIAGLSEGGLRVPRDVSIVGIDDLYLDALVSPTVTSIRQPIPEIAEAMIGRLVKRIETPNLVPAEQVFRPALVVRNSVRRLSGARG
jgi:DNA-binding LacI/PurR family transcriptional regulator